MPSTLGRWFSEQEKNWRSGVSSKPWGREGRERREGREGRKGGRGEREGGREEGREEEGGSNHYRMNVCATPEHQPHL